MKTIQSLIIVSVFLLTATCLSAETAQDILNKSVAAYQGLETFSVEGTAIRESVVRGSQAPKITSTFSMRLKKPNLYRITWNNNEAPRLSYATWNDGKQPYQYMSHYNAYWPVENIEESFTFAANGASKNIPYLFFESILDTHSPFSPMKAPLMKGSEVINGEDCYVISSPSRDSKEETYWISKSSFLIHQYRYSLETPDGWHGISEMTKEKYNKQIYTLSTKIMEAQTFQERKEFEKKMIEIVKANSEGIFIETYNIISFPELDENDIAFSPPEGADLRESIVDAHTHRYGTVSSNTPRSNTPTGNDRAQTPLPNDDLSVQYEKALLSSCINNLKQLGLVFKMYSNESAGEMAPPLISRSGYLMWKKDDTYPEYMVDPSVLVCPAETEKEQQVNALADFNEKVPYCLDNSSYWYLGYAIPNEETGLAFVEAYKKQAETGDGFENDLQDANGKVILRLREGIEKLVNTEGMDMSKSITSQLPLIVERPGHHPGKINVIYVDGHAETLDYPGEFPASKIFIEALHSLDTLR